MRFLSVCFQRCCRNRHWTREVRNQPMRGGQQFVCQHTPLSKTIHNGKSESAVLFCLFCMCLFLPSPKQNTNTNLKTNQMEKRPSRWWQQVCFSLGPNTEILKWQLPDETWLFDDEPNWESITNTRSCTSKCMAFQVTIKARSCSRVNKNGMSPFTIGVPCSILLVWNLVSLSEAKCFLLSQSAGVTKGICSWIQGISAKNRCLSFLSLIVVENKEWLTPFWSPVHKNHQFNLLQKNTITEVNCHFCAEPFWGHSESILCWTRHMAPGLNSPKLGFCKSQRTAFRH